MTPSIVSVPGDPGDHAIWATVSPFTTFWQS